MAEALESVKQLYDAGSFMKYITWTNEAKEMRKMKVFGRVVSIINKYWMNSISITSVIVPYAQH